VQAHIAGSAGAFRGSAPRVCVPCKGKLTQFAKGTGSQGVVQRPGSAQSGRQDDVCGGGRSAEAGT